MGIVTSAFRQFMKKVIAGREVEGAPQWLKDCMEALRKLPPPTLEEVKTVFAASANWEWDCVKKIKKASYIR